MLVSANVRVSESRQSESDASQSVLNSFPFCGACVHFPLSADSVSGVLTVLVLPAL